MLPFYEVVSPWTAFLRNHSSYLIVVAQLLTSLYYHIIPLTHNKKINTWRKYWQTYDLRAYFFHTFHTIWILRKQIIKLFTTTHFLCGVFVDHRPNMGLVCLISLLAGHFNGILIMNKCLILSFFLPGGQKWSDTIVLYCLGGTYQINLTFWPSSIQNQNT